ncbi:lysophospholipid acyltransferase family protein [Pseudokineococcus sp. 5B2Z-1]|uniref:lysophospholipid acyltransferase family protein n=1 Tax=Pseudokineococcus sp. 5B2Z-1 TaxID=3132744 RepID=UPI0030A889CD
MSSRGGDGGDRPARARPERVYPPVIGLAKTAFRVLGVRTRLEGLEHVPATGGVVLAINHVGYADFVFAGLAPWEAHRRLTRFMAKESIFRHPVAGPLMRGMHHIPVDRSAGSASLRAALRALHAGEVVGLFPEATISRSFTVKPIRSGALRMAASARVPVLPTAVWGTQRLLGKGTPRDLTRGQTVQVSVGEPLEVTPRTVEECAVELRRRLQVQLDALQATHPDTAHPGPHAWWLPAHLGGTAPTPEEAAEVERERGL